jgi:hypothetical protein
MNSGEEKRGRGKLVRLPPDPRRLSYQQEEVNWARADRYARNYIRLDANGREYVAVPDEAGARRLSGIAERLREHMLEWVRRQPDGEDFAILGRSADKGYSHGNN